MLRSNRRSMACASVSWFLREVLQGHQRLLEIRGHRLAVCRARQRSGPGLPAVDHGLVPYLAPEGMMGEAVDLLGKAVGRRASRGRHNAARGGRAAVPGGGSIGYLVGQGMLESVTQVGEEVASRTGTRSPANALGSPCNAASGISAMACSNAKGTSVPITVAVWSRRFSSNGRRSMRAASTVCTVAGTCTVGGRAPDDRPLVPRQHAGLDQSTHAFFQEKRITLRPLYRGAA